MDNLTYWAALPTEEIAAKLAERENVYYEHLRISGHLRKINKSYQMYMGQGKYDPSQIDQAGEKGELLRVKVNHYRSLLTHTHVLTTQNRPATKSVAINNDFISQTSARLGDNLLDYYFKTKHYEHLLKEATELALVTSKAYVVMRWDTQKGQEYGATEDGKVVYDGDVGAKAFSCLDVVEDIFASDTLWYIVRERVNKYDLAAQFPEYAQELIQSSDQDSDLTDFRMHAITEDDLIWKCTFVHKKTPAVPNGRQVEYVGDDIVLTDGPLPYKDLLVFPIMPGKIAGTQLGYTPGFDILSLNDALNSAWSSIITNVDTFGTNNVWIAPGSNINPISLPGGLTVIESDSEPKPISLAQSNPDVWRVTEAVRVEMETLTGINDVVRGNPGENLRSGNALALVAAQALAYNSGLQASYAQLLVSVSMGIIWLLQDFASTPRMAVIVGQANQSLLQQFTGDKLQGIDRVAIEEVSAVSRTTAGKMEFATNLLQQGIITDAQDYMTIIETGRLDPITSPKAIERMAIDREAELLRSGAIPVQAVMTENHARHIQGHAQILSDPYMKMNPEVVGRVLEHIQEHINLAQSPGYQVIGQILGHQPIPPPPMPPGPQANGGEALQPPSAEGQAPGQPGMPSLPPGAPPELQPAADQVNQLGQPQQ